MAKISISNNITELLRSIESVIRNLHVSVNSATFSMWASFYIFNDTLLDTLKIFRKRLMQLIYEEMTTPEDH